VVEEREGIVIPEAVHVEALAMAGEVDVVEVLEGKVRG